MQCQVYKNLNKTEYNEETEFLIEPITKITILCAVSLMITLLNMSLSILWVVMDYSAILGKIGNYSMTLDIYTNFLCVIFCDKIFKQRYLCICSCLDDKCRRCWKDMVDIEDRHPYISDNVPTRQMTLHWGLSSNSTRNSKSDEHEIESPQSNEQSQDQEQQEAHLKNAVNTDVGTNV